jgi:D-glycero-D-manno-heptose 1,7-bisphosphate phosphatase
MNAGSARPWTLFLDRDGVINRQVVGDYVREWSQFEFLPGAREALVTLSRAFDLIIVVTNQRGVGRGLMSEAELSAIHRRMCTVVESDGGRIDRVYHCPHDFGARCECRKPGTGLVRQAMDDFPMIELTRALLVGDADSDMTLAHRLGIPSVLVGRAPVAGATPPTAGAYRSLAEFSAALDARSVRHLPPVGANE